MKSSKTCLLFVKVLLVMTLLFSACVHATKDNKTYFFNIPETTIDKALNHLGQQANVPVLFPFDQVRHIPSLQLTGHFTLKHALACIMQKTSLYAKVTATGAVIIVAKSEKETVPITTVNTAEYDLSVCNPLAAETHNEEDEISGFVFEEILVNARRYSESLKNIPSSVTSISGLTLQNSSESNLTAIGNVSPNVNFTTAGAVSGSTSVAVIYIRGIGQNDYVPVLDPSVGIYVDDVYYGRAIGAAFNLVDVHSIEVLRGPQGTLFGRNTIGGALSVKTYVPTGNTEGNIRTIVGDQGQREIYLTQNAQLSDRANGRFSLARLIMDGTVARVNVPDSSKLGNENSSAARFKVDWTPSDRMQLLFAGDYSREREESAPEVNVHFREDAVLPTAWNGFDDAQFNAIASTASGCVKGRPDLGIDCYNDRFVLGPFKSAETSLSRNDVDTWGVSTAVHIDAVDNTWNTQFIVAHRELKAFLARQVDGSSLDIFENRESYLSKQLSLDLRFSGAFKQAHLVGGFFYFIEKSDNQLNFAGALNGTEFPVHIGGQTDNKNIAAYGQLDVDLTKLLHLSIGLRYTDEIKRATPNAFMFVGCDIDLTPLNPQDCPASDAGFLIPKVEQEISFSKNTWNAALAYDVNQYDRVYFSVSTGFKSGGFEWRVADDSLRNLAISRAQNTGLSHSQATEFVNQNGALPSFKPETVISYELGFKSENLEQGVRYSIAAFNSLYQDQIVATNPSGLATLQTNAAESSVRGVEFEILWMPSQYWSVNMGIGYVDARYKRLTQAALDGGLRLKDKPIFTPAWNATLSVSYSLSLMTGELIPQLETRYKSSQEFEPVNTEYTRDDGFIEFDALTRYLPKHERWELTAGIKNITNERYKIGGDANNVIGYENVIYARPRNAYLSFTYSW